MKLNISFPNKDEALEAYKYAKNKSNTSGYILDLIIKDMKGSENNKLDEEEIRKIVKEEIEKMNFSSHEIEKNIDEKFIEPKKEKEEHLDAFGEAQIIL